MTPHRFIYIAHPIDFDGGLAVAGWVLRIKAELVDAGLGWYDPQPGWATNGIGVGPEIDRVNHHALSVCTGVIAVMIDGVPSIGTPREVEKAKLGWAKPVAVVTDASRVAWGITEGPLLRIFDPADYEGSVTTAIQAAVNWLRAQPPGVTPFDRGGTRKKPLPYLVAPGQLHPRLTRSYADDAGLDLWVTEDTRILPGQFADIPSGIDGIELPDDCWGMITGRSSTLRAKGLLVHTAVIDSGWRGPLYAGAQNVSDQAVIVRKGERIAQLILMTNRTAAYQPTQVERLSSSERGNHGFGSTGA